MKPLRRSLHIGLNGVSPAHYEGDLPRLACAERDAQAMRVLCEYAAFDASPLLAAEATTTAVIGWIRETAAAARGRPAEVVISYSGHGGTVADLAIRDDEPEDQTWCLYDAMLIDDELRYAISAFDEQARVTIVSDSCHSGSVADIPDEERPRVITGACAMSIVERNQAYYDGVTARLENQQAVIRCAFTSLSACRDDEVAKEDDNLLRGYFTDALRSVANKWRITRPAGVSYLDLRQAIDERVNGDRDNGQHCVVSHAGLAGEREPIFFVTW